MNLKHNSDLWSYLSGTDKKIVMYGMGNGADKILSVCEKYGIEVSDFFASDGFVRGHSFHGKRVLSFGEVKEKYGAENIIVLLSFGSSLPDVIENILRISRECELYAPDVPVFGENLFTLDFYRENAEKIERAYSLLSDDVSRRTFCDIISFKLTGDIKYLEREICLPDEVYRDILRAKSFENCIDIGAYNGDSLRALAEYAPNLKTAIAIEPDRRNFKKLEIYADTEKRFEVLPIKAAAWSGSTTLCFDGSGNRNSNVSESGTRSEVEAVSVDGICDVRRIDYIKYDVEGSEERAIMGSVRTIKTSRPFLLVSLYHRSEDIFALPLMLSELCRDYRFYLRRYRYIPAWDINLLCVPIEKEE